MSNFIKDNNKFNYTTKKVQRNSEAFINNDDFWTNWKVHREQITSLIDRHIISNYDHETVAIWGAGRCNDIDLKFLSTQFKEVHLFDKKTEGIEKGIVSQELTDEQISRIKVHSGFDFIGTEDKFYDQIEDLLLAKAPTKQIIKLIRSQANQLNSEKPFQNLNRTFDVSISLGVHSQLFERVMLLLDKYTEHFGKDNSSKIYDECRYLYKVGSRTYNEFLYATVKTGGVLYTGLDLLEFSMQLNTLHLIPEFNKALLSGNILSILPRYFNTCSVMGSLDAFSELLDHPSIQNSDIPINFWLWDYFNFQSYFFITIGIVKRY